ncbi:MAG: hypothetical protein LBN26_05240 [Christensenellaceae bacterium]|jgi:FSR family fosmidomycin resistance protein-like MFS transporter|nr:hypothetical protein [Christensenellaceae bacterium]
MFQFGTNGRTAILAVAHACVDGVCAAAMYGIVKPATAAGGVTFFALVAIYNLLAFPLQALVGLTADHIPARRTWLVAVLLAFPLLWLTPLPPVALAVLLGVCNSMFHVLGGIDTLETSRGKMTKLGIFVAPGAVGLAVGLMFPPSGAMMGAMLALLALGYRLTKSPSQEEKAPPPALPLYGGMKVLLPAMVLLSVACRGMGGSVIAYGWKTGFVLPVVFAVIVAGGKAAGGLLSDRLGERGVAIAAAVAATLILPLSADIPPLALFGQLCINITMPVTLMLLYRAMPRNPGFSFGMAAGVLYPGTLTGKLLNGALPEYAMIPVLLLIFGVNAAILAFALEMGNKKRKGEPI